MSSSEKVKAVPPAAGPGANAPAGAAPACPAPAPREVSHQVTETISNASAGNEHWNGTYQWDSKFTLAVDPANCTVTATVKVKVNGTATDAQKQAWKNAIETKWNNKVKLDCPGRACKAACPNGFAVKVELKYVDSGEHYPIDAQDPGAGGGGVEGLGGTTSMQGWGKNDTVDITHEFGHMLGNPEEYFTTDGHDYTDGGTVDGFRDPHGGIMNNPDNDPLPRNYESIRKEASSMLGDNCTTQPR